MKQELQSTPSPDETQAPPELVCGPHGVTAASVLSRWPGVRFQITASNEPGVCFRVCGPAGSYTTLTTLPVSRALIDHLCRMATDHNYKGGAIQSPDNLGGAA